MDKRTRVTRGALAAFYPERWDERDELCLCSGCSERETVLVGYDGACVDDRAGVWELDYEEGGDCEVILSQALLCVLFESARGLGR